MSKQSDNDGLLGLIFLVGSYEGVLPFVSKIFDWHPFLAFPTRLDAPWWWLVSGAVIVVAAALMCVLDSRRQSGGADTTHDAIGTPGR